MKRIVIIHGQKRKRGSNYNISRNLALKINSNSADIVEHFVNDLDFCTGCSNCILRGEDKCPHKDKIMPIAKDIEAADILIINSPTYVMEMTGQLKVFFDHMAYRYIVHRPHKSMEKKIAVLISTAAGSGAKRVTKSLANQMLWWGVGKSYQIHFSVFSSDWEGVKEEIKNKIDKKSNEIAENISSLTNVKRSIKGQLYFNIMKKVQTKMNNPIDIAHWKENGWIK